MLSIEEIQSRINDFPTLPTIYTRLMEVIANPRTTVQDVADVIVKDQSSTAKVLKVVNSPIYGIPGTVKNVTQAIFFIGFNEVKNIVLTLSVLDIFAKTDSIPLFNIIDLWKHSIAVASITKLLGVRLKIRNTEDFFVSGILHDVGVLYYLKNYPEEYNSIYSKAIQKNEPLAYHERKVFGYDHYYIGGLIAEKWKLPLELRHVVSYQDKGTVEGKADLMLSCVHLANIIAHVLNLDYQKDRMIDNPNFLIWNQLHLEPGSIKNMYSNIMELYHQSVSILQI